MKFAALLRRLLALLVFFFSFWIWTRHSDVIDLIARQRPVLFGRYSQGHAGALIILTPILWAVTLALASRQPLRRTLGNTAIGIATSLIAIIAVTYFAHFFARAPLYVENPLTAEQAKTMHLAGEVRRRPPNQSYELIYNDVPEQARSYPDAPPGYPDIKVRLTTDANGFRNVNMQSQYDILAVGDSFVAGSNVSDEQCWSALLAKATNHSVYNLGVGGSGPPTYMSNYVYFGLNFKPRVALFMIYEGNDFKEDVVINDPKPPTLPQRIAQHIEDAMHSSPVTLGLKRLSHDVFEKLGSTKPVPKYKEKLGFMPIALRSGDTTHYYSFEPKRAIYLNYSVAEFSTSPEWQATAKILQQIISISREHNIKPAFIYAPSAPHVVLPLVKDDIPAEQLRYFSTFKQKHLPPAEQFKQQLFENLDSEQKVVLDFCETQGIDCIALTDALRSATAAGRQTYFSYDQHWTPDGHMIAASAIEQFLREKGYL